MTAIQDLISPGRDLGYQGEELQKFVSSQQAQQREERDQARRWKREEAEREEEREKERQHVLALEQLKLQQSSGNSGVVTSGSDNVLRPSLPTYKEVEDLASYFTHFERLASLLNIATGSWAVCLGSLLVGKLANVYVSLPDDITPDYQRLKNSLLRYFHQTSDHYRSTFRSSENK